MTSPWRSQPKHDVARPSSARALHILHTPRTARIRVLDNIFGNDDYAQQQSAEKDRHGKSRKPETKRATAMTAHPRRHIYIIHQVSRHNQPVGSLDSRLRINKQCSDDLAPREMKRKGATARISECAIGRREMTREIMSKCYTIEQVTNRVTSWRFHPGEFILLAKRRGDDEAESSSHEA